MAIILVVTGTPGSYQRSIKASPPGGPPTWRPHISCKVRCINVMLSRAGWRL